MDLFLDSRADLDRLIPNSSQGKATELQNASNSSTGPAKCRIHIERNTSRSYCKVTSEPCGTLRPSRISIQLSNGQIIPSLQSLSEGQSQLFHLFATIIRYGERDDINRSIHLSRDITGIVLIDEIDAHLHPSLQYEVVPQLIKLFPKVQFIVSSHSPLFLLGMEKAYSVRTDSPFSNYQPEEELLPSNSPSSEACS